ncbi:hypothetical protein FQR65_LT15118 [Abscondita terminalis]|nr:hypothetical protein FQR65_LT15118 [Abscondita terminalis]
MENQTSLENIPNINELCRVCLLESKEMRSLSYCYEANLEENISKVWQVLQRIMSVKISLDDRFPSKICIKCMEELYSFYEFKLKFDQSQQILSTYFKQDLNESNHLISVIELIEDYSEMVPVELISKHGKFDLKDVLVVEQDQEEPYDFAGFLSKLGTEVSASFVNNEPLGESSFNDSYPEYDNDNTDFNLSNKENKTKCMNKRKKSNEGKGCDAPITCTTCSRKFANEVKLKVHIDNKHNNKNETFMCEFCGILLKSKSSYYHHMLKYKGKKFICNLCQKSYSNSSALQLHIAAVHKNMRTHLCTICGKQFNYSNALTYHMRIHTDERKYKCTYCDKTFRIQCSLDRHLRTHTGIRPYKCSYCIKSFRSKGELDCHEMTHTGYRPYHCKYCKKGFTKTYNLKLHLLNHKGQHCCPNCNKSFIELEFLKTHMQCSHSDNGIIDEVDM